MLTMNCDAHPLLRRFHKPEPDLPPNAQDKRTVIPLEIDDLRTWLTGSIQEASALIRLPALELFAAAPSTPAQPAMAPLLSETGQ